MEDCINPNSIGGDNLLEVEEDNLNNSELFPDNDICFTEDDFIESINNNNDATIGIVVIIILLGIKYKTLKLSNIFLMLLIWMVL